MQKAEGRRQKAELALLAMKYLLCKMLRWRFATDLLTRVVGDADPYKPYFYIRSSIGASVGGGAGGVEPLRPTFSPCVFGDF